VRKRDDARQQAESLYKTVNDVVGEMLPLPKCLEPPLPPIRPFFASPVKAASDARKMNSSLPPSSLARHQTSSSSAGGSRKHSQPKKSSPNKNKRR
jgi:hypothetical protein